MVKVTAKEFVFFVLIILFVNFSSASFSAGNSNGIETFYGAGETIRGWINVSLTSEESTSVLESSLGGTIRLLELINLPSNSAFIYDCNPASCLSDYLADNEETAKTFSLGEDETALFGMKITADENVGDISDFHFDLSSNNPGTDKMPLEIDVLDDGQIEWRAYSSSENFGEEDFGCFIGTDTTSQLIASTPQYCEKISLSETPGAEIGTYVTYVKGTGSVNFEMSIENSDGTGEKICTATASGTGTERIACSPSDFSIEEAGEYFVCIRTKTATDNGKYRINSEQTSPCGFTGNYDGDYNYDFEIFASRKEYAPSISITLDNEELDNANSPIFNLGNYIDDYLFENYENNCQERCVIPIRIYSGISQQVDISNMFMSYIADTYTEETGIYTLEETPAEISSSSQKLFLDGANFSVPSTYGNHTFSVSLNDEEILSKKISVGEIAQVEFLTPTMTAVKYPTTFKAETTGGNITGYVWDFGDGETQSTSVNQVNHVYDIAGDYILKVTIKSLKGNSSKEFNIAVRAASEVVPTLLEEADSSVDVIRSYMENFSQFEQESIDNILNLSSVEDTLGGLNDAVLTASSETEFEEILAELIGINLPIAIAKTAIGEDITFYPAMNNINIGLLKGIGSGNYTAGKEDEYRDAVFAWYNANVKNDLVYSEISLIYDDREESLKIFDMHITKKGTAPAYLIIKNMENLFLEGQKDYSEKNGYFYTDLNGGKDISFSTTDEVDFVDVPMFISPSLENLVIIEITPFSKINWTLLIIIIAIIILIMITLWAILQFWYIRKYESYLFKDRNQLYNLVNYVNDAKKKGESNNDISVKLRKAGWNSEQIRYVLRKYEKKNTGLPEIIPIKKILDELRKNTKKK